MGIGVDFNSVAVWILKVDGFAYQVVGGAKTDPPFGKVVDKPGQVRTVRKQNGKVVEAGPSFLFWLDAFWLHQGKKLGFSISCKCS